MQAGTARGELAYLIRGIVPFAGQPAECKACNRCRGWKVPVGQLWAPSSCTFASIERIEFRTSSTPRGPTGEFSSSISFFSSSARRSLRRSFLNQSRGGKRYLPAHRGRESFRACLHEILEGGWPNEGSEAQLADVHRRSSGRGPSSACAG